jgi:hypothetical protein
MSKITNDSSFIDVLRVGAPQARAAAGRKESCA